MNRNLWPFIFLAPFMLAYAALSLFPILYSFMLSFLRWDGIGKREVVGLDNYIQLFTKDPYFFKSIGNTLIIILEYLPLQIIVGMILASLLYSRFIKLRRAFQFINFLPYITTPVSLGILFALIFDWQIGLMNKLLVALGVIGTEINWLGEVTYARLVIGFLIFWKGFGFSMIVYLAGMAGLSKEVYEAAEVDGANAVRKFIHLTIPLVKPFTIFLAMTGAIYGFQIFEEPMQLLNGWANSFPTKGGPDNSVLTVMWYFYDTTFGSSNRLGYGSAITYGLFMIIGACTLLFYRLSQTKEEK